MIRQQDGGTMQVNARFDLSDLAEELGILLPTGRYSSLVDFLLEKAGDVSTVASQFGFKQLQFTILRGFAQSINEVKIS